MFLLGMSGGELLAVLWMVAFLPRTGSASHNLRARRGAKAFEDILELPGIAGFVFGRDDPMRIGTSYRIPLASDGIRRRILCILNMEVSE